MISSSFRVLATSASYVLGHLFESVVVIDKADDSQIDAGDHYGEPTVGLISGDERWFITGGFGLECYSAETGLLTFFRRGYPPLGVDEPELDWFVHSARMESLHVVRILIDPWSEASSVWLLDLDTCVASRLCDGPFVGDSPHRDAVDY